MDYTVWIIGAGVFLCFLGYDFGNKCVLWNVMSLGICLILGSPILNRLITGLNNSNEMGNVGAALLIIAAGAIVVGIMNTAFKTSSPVSTSLEQYAVFGWCKWDDFAQIWLLGAVALIGASLFLGYELLYAWNRGEADAAYKSTPVTVSASPPQSAQKKVVRQSKANGAAAVAVAKHSKRSKPRVAGAPFSVAKATMNKKAGAKTKTSTP
ncbi:MAG: hypothetical protein K2W95_10015 [Candidatus Obscuribacterales bacterium]|nr:hypothetical protein [Candidatus Obscuribacterales bacterium]